MTQVHSRSADLVSSERILTDGVEVSLITLNEPERMNPLGRDALSALHDRLLESTAPDAPPIIVITGAGSAFSAGGDLRDYQSLFDDRQAFFDFLVLFQTVCQLLERCDQLTVAALNGVCVAGGLELALSCDLITMAEDARVGDGHLRYGQLPGAGSSQRLVRALGVQRAKHWLLTGRLFSADEAVAAGLAVASFPRDSLLTETLQLVKEAASHSPLARRLVKQLVDVAQRESLAVGLAFERDAAINYACDSPDGRQGLAEFFEGRENR